ncbi:hypothetical protein BU14_2239s0001, partial [Porphyra umbilicalis]
APQQRLDRPPVCGRVGKHRPDGVHARSEKRIVDGGPTDAAGRRGRRRRRYRQHIGRHPPSTAPVDIHRRRQERQHAPPRAAANRGEHLVHKTLGRRRAGRGGRGAGAGASTAAPALTDRRYGRRCRRRPRARADGECGGAPTGGAAPAGGRRRRGRGRDAGGTRGDGGGEGGAPPPPPDGPKSSSNRPWSDALAASPLLPPPPPPPPGAADARGGATSSSITSAMRRSSARTAAADARRGRRRPTPSAAAAAAAVAAPPPPAADAHGPAAGAPASGPPPRRSEAPAPPAAVDDGVPPSVVDAARAARRPRLAVPAAANGDVAAARLGRRRPLMVGSHGGRVDGLFLEDDFGVRRRRVGQPCNDYRPRVSVSKVNPLRHLAPTHGVDGRPRPARRRCRVAGDNVGKAARGARLNEHLLAVGERRPHGATARAEARRPPKGDAPVEHRVRGKKYEHAAGNDAGKVGERPPELDAVRVCRPVRVRAVERPAGGADGDDQGEELRIRDDVRVFNADREGEAELGFNRVHGRECAAREEHRPQAAGGHAPHRNRRVEAPEAEG